MASTVGKILTFMISPVGSLVGNMPTKEELADRWIRENLPKPNEYNATLATLTNDITKWSNTCGDYIHTRNPLYNRANSRSICQGKIEQVFQSDLIALKDQEVIEAQAAKTGGTISPNMLKLIIVAIIIMVVIVIVIKM